MTTDRARLESIVFASTGCRAKRQSNEKVCTYLYPPLATCQAARLRPSLDLLLVTAARHDPAIWRRKRVAQRWIVWRRRDAWMLLRRRQSLALVVIILSHLRDRWLER